MVVYQLCRDQTNSVPNLSEIEQSAAELLRFQYLTYCLRYCLRWFAPIHPFRLFAANPLCHALSDLDFWLTDLESIGYIGCYVIIVCCKFERNRTVCRWVIKLRDVSRKAFINAARPSPRQTMQRPPIKCIPRGSVICVTCCATVWDNLQLLLQSIQTSFPPSPNFLQKVKKCDIRLHRSPTLKSEPPLFRRSKIL